MSAAIVLALLAGAADVTAQVPAQQIHPGAPPPAAAATPALFVGDIATVPEPGLDGRAAFSLMTCQVQVTAVSGDYGQVKALIDAVRRACNFQSGRIAGFDVVSILRAQTGPDTIDDAGMYRQPIDFSVTYFEPN